MPAPIRVVAVDDEETVLQLFEQSLDGLADIHLVGVGRNGREAIQLVNRLHPDVIFLDINMPVLNGLEAAARITSLFPRTAIAILTSEQSKELMREALRSGVREYLDKSTIRPKQLPDVIRRICSTQGGTAAQMPERGLGSVWSFYGPKGSSGTTTQALNTAAGLACFGYRVMLLDLDLIQGDLKFYLDSEWLQAPPSPQISLLSRLSELSSLETDTIRRGTHRLTVPAALLPPDASEGEFHLDLIASPCQVIGLDDTATANLTAMIEFLTGIYDFVVVDLPPGRIFERGTAVALDFSEKFFLVSNQDLSSLKAVHLFSQVLAQTAFSKEKITILLSPVVKTPKLDSTQWLKERVTYARETLEIPEDQATAAEAVADGQPYALTHHETALAHFSRKLVASALNQVPSTGRTLNFWERLHRDIKKALTV